MRYIKFPSRRNAEIYLERKRKRLERADRAEMRDNGVKHVVRNTTATLNKFIDMVDSEDSVIKVTDTMTLVTTGDGRKGKVYTKDLTNFIRIREDVRANDALAYTEFVKGRKEARKEKVVVDSKISRGDGSDFGKIRFCRECGLQVLETVDSDISVCPKCGEKHEYDKEVYTMCMDDEVVYDFNDPDGIQHDNIRDWKLIQPDFFDGYKWANKAYLKKDPKLAKWLRANRDKLADIKSEWVDGEELSLSMDVGSGDDANPVMRDISPMEHQKMLDYSTRLTEVTDRKVIGLRTGFRRNLLRNPKVAKARLNALRPLVCKDEIARLEYLLEDTTSVYEYVFKAKVHDALHNGIIDMRWVNANKFKLKGKMWKYTGNMNKSYWAAVKKDTKPEAIRVFNLTPEGNKCKYQSCSTCSASITCNRLSTSTDRKWTDQQHKDEQDFGQTDYSPEYPDVY